MVDLPLVDEDACVLGNEVAVKRGVFGGAEKKISALFILFFFKYI